MNASISYPPGGDAQAIARVAGSYFGSYANMFKAHGWEVPGDKMMTTAPALIAKHYGDIRQFDETYSSGTTMFPMAAIYKKPPNVWLTSFWGFRPGSWGFLGFTKKVDFDAFLRESEPGALVVIYVASKGDKKEIGKVAGVLQVSHQTGDAEHFMPPAEWARKQADPDMIGRWSHAIKAIRAWRVTEETRPDVGQFAPEFTKTGAWQTIGARGVRLTSHEALNILKLDLQEVDVYGENSILESLVGSARDILAPSKAGPVSQSPFVTTESEGPKHLYVLKLSGDTSAFLGEPANGKVIVKAGFSKSPQTRCDDHNRTLPKCAYEWKVLYSGTAAGLEPYPTSDHAKAGERAMQTVLCKSPHGRSLGGEFFLAENNLIEDAWRAGNLAAKDYKK